MENAKLRLFILLTALGFVVVIIIELMLFGSFNSITEQQNQAAREIYGEHVEKLCLDSLSSMARYMESRYPGLRDVDALRREAGTDWFWNTAAEWAEIADIFGFTYIYYIAKIDGDYRFLMSSGITREEHPEWLGTPVWQGEPPAYVEAAYAAKEPRVSPEPTVNEWGTLLGAVVPVLANGEVAGILGTAYDTAFVQTAYAGYELRLAERHGVQERSLLTLFILSIVFTFVVMGGQILLSYRSVLVPLRVMEADMRIRLMMDATPLICGLWDSGGNMVDCNQEALTIFGLAEKPD